MANGLLGTADISAASNTTVYTVPADNFAVITINMVNRSSTDRNIRVALAASASPSAAEYIEYDATLIANGVLERSGIVVDAGKNIVVYANSTDVSCVVYGLETSTV